jgi:hypothetical protein
MKLETNGWGDSMVATKYMYERISDILNKQTKDQICYHLSRLNDELALNFKSDTGKGIGEVK